MIRFDFNCAPSDGRGAVFLKREFVGFVGLPAALLFLRPPVEMIFEFYVFTGRFAHLTPFGDPIFRCTTKDRGERRGKGVATPFHSPGVNVDMICRIGASRFPPKGTSFGARIGAPPEF